MVLVLVLLIFSSRTLSEASHNQNNTNKHQNWQCQQKSQGETLQRFFYPLANSLASLLADSKPCFDDRIYSIFCTWVELSLQFCMPSHLRSGLKHAKCELHRNKSPGHPAYLMANSTGKHYPSARPTTVQFVFSQCHVKVALTPIRCS